MADTDKGIDSTTLVSLTAQIVSAYAGKAPLSPEQLNETIDAVAGALRGVGGPSAEPPSAQQMPAVPIKKSVTPEFIVCLEDGKKLKMLKRHLRTAYGMTPAEYRAKWGLPHDYPMAAPAYAARRSTLAKSIGLGRSAPAGKTASKLGGAGKPAVKRGRPRKVSPTSEPG